MDPVVLAALVAAGVGLLAGGLSAVVGVWGLRRRERRALADLQDDVEHLGSRFEREVKRRASEKGVAARTAQEEIRDMIAAGAHRAPVAAAAPPRPLTKREMLAAVRRQRPAGALNGAATEAEA